MAARIEAYVDTSAFIAFMDASDTYHPLFRRLFAAPPSVVVTTSLVIAEGHGWFLRRFDRVREVVGPLADRAPDCARALLERWAADEDHWMRRTVLLRFLLPVRRSDRAAFVVFAGYADRMLEEKEFFIRKAIGWVLREYGKRAPEEVAAWLEPRLARAAGLTVREACKHLPEATREALLAARGTSEVATRCGAPVAGVRSATDGDHP